jgi:hypothetical protein
MVRVLWHPVLQHSATLFGSAVSSCVSGETQKHKQQTALHGFTRFLVIFREKHPVETKEAFCNTASMPRA